MTLSDRDELAREVRPVLSEYGAWGTLPPERPLGVPEWGDSLSSESSDCPEAIAAALWAAGWRKKPSREALVDALGGSDDPVLHDLRISVWGATADAILALMDGPTETGEK